MGCLFVHFCQNPIRFHRPLILNSKYCTRQENIAKKSPKFSLFFIKFPKNRKKLENNGIIHPFFAPLSTIKSPFLPLYNG